MKYKKSLMCLKPLKRIPKISSPYVKAKSPSKKAKVPKKKAEVSEIKSRSRKRTKKY